MFDFQINLGKIMTTKEFLPCRDGIKSANLNVFKSKNGPVKSTEGYLIDI